jgi:hypothetical protein
VEAHIRVGVLMMLSGPVAIVAALIASDAGYKDIAAVLIGFGLIGSLWFGLLGYRVLRGMTAVSEVRGYLVAFAIVIVGAFIFGNCPTQSR